MRSLQDEDEDGYNDNVEAEASASDTTTSGAYANYDPFSVQPFVEGMSEYDEYQQSWRLLGFMIDCNTVMYDDDQYSSGGSGDEITEEGCARYVIWAAYVDLDYEGGGIGEYQYWNRTSGDWDKTSCEYAEAGSGGSNNSGDGGDDDDDEYESRCAKMDCHLEDTHFSVLGFFKHRNHDDWMEQLFKHEGMCVWSEDEYTFMKNARKAWPKGCAYSGTSISTGKKSNSDNDNEDEADGDGDDDYVSNTIPLFYNIKPLRNGRIAMGLYTDEQCIEEYPADTDYIESILGNVFLAAGSQHSQDNDDGDEEELYYSGDTLSESMDRWDSAFDVWHMCHPCVAHDLENTGGTKYTDDDDGYGYDDDVNNYYYKNGQYYYYGDDGNNADDGNNVDDGNAGRRRMNRKARSRKLGGEYAAEGDVFECYDDAGYTNVNQCMKFSAKTVMKTATFRDLSLGRHQGSLVEYPLSGYFDASSHYRGKTMGNIVTYFFLVSAAGLLTFSFWNLYKVVKQTKRANVGSATTSDGLLL